MDWYLDECDGVAEPRTWGSERLLMAFLSSEIGLDAGCGYAKEPGGDGQRNFTVKGSVFLRGGRTKLCARILINIKCDIKFASNGKKV